MVRFAATMGFMPVRSWWGWGTIENRVTGPEKTQLLSRVTQFLDGNELREHAPPSIDTLDMCQLRITPPPALEHLTSSDPHDRAGHAHGKAFRDVIRNLRGHVKSAPDLVVRPVCEADILRVLDWCSESNITVIPYGGGRSDVGGVEARFDDDRRVISLDLERLNKVLEVDQTSRAARIQGGVLGPHLSEQLRAHDLTLRHFPQSFEFSSLGGWLATRAGGHYATGPTHIDDFVESLRVVTPTGISESRRLPGSGAGPSHDRLFLGSEGTLGIITEAWMRLQKRPTFRTGASVNFTDFMSASEAVRAISQSGLNPSNCRLLDPMEAFINAGSTAAGGVLVLGFESDDHPQDALLARALELCADFGALVQPVKSDGPATSADTWKSSFLRMPYQRDVLAAHSIIAETFESACTWDRWPEFYQAVTTAANQAMSELGIMGVVTCRFTHVYPDGPAPYFGVYAAGKWESLLGQWDHIKSAVSESLITSGGTITHHHAVGRDHRPGYDQQRSNLFASSLRAVKSTLDPAGILNPGVLFDL